MCGVDYSYVFSDDTDRKISISKSDIKLQFSSSLNLLKYKFYFYYNIINNFSFEKKTIKTANLASPRVLRGDLKYQEQTTVCDVSPLERLAALSRALLNTNRNHPHLYIPT